MVAPLGDLEIAQRMRQFLEANTQLRGFHRGSVVDALTKMTGAIGGMIYYDLARTADFMSLDRCKGQRLDRRARHFYGAPERMAETTATGPGVFHRDTSATAPDISEPIPIFSGTIVIAPETATTRAIRYQTTEDAEIPADELTSNTISVVATESGADSNVSAGELSTLEASVSGVSRFENLYAIQNGRPEENDDEYLRRIKRWIQALSRATRPALIQAALAQVYNEERILAATVRELDTPGKVLVYCDNGSGNPSQSILALVQEDIDGNPTDWQASYGVRAGGVRATVLAPSVQIVSIEYALELVDPLGVNRNSLMASVNRLLMSYVNTLWPGETLTYNQLVKEILASQEGIVEDVELAVNGGTSDIIPSTHVVLKTNASNIVGA